MQSLIVIPDRFRVLIDSIRAVAVQAYDLIMLLVLVAATIFGAIKGFAWQVASLASIFVSYFVAYNYRHQVAELIDARPPWNQFLAMLLLYAGSTFAIWVVFRLVSGQIDRVRLKEFDRHLGAGFGFIKGALFCLLITMFAVTLTDERKQQAICQSRSGYYISKFLANADGLLPAEIEQVIGPRLDALEQKLNQHQNIDGNGFNNGEFGNAGFGTAQSNAAGAGFGGFGFGNSQNSGGLFGGGNQIPQSQPPGQGPPGQGFGTGQGFGNGGFISAPAPTGSSQDNFGNATFRSSNASNGNFGTNQFQSPGQPSGSFVQGITQGLQNQFQQGVNDAINNQLNNFRDSLQSSNSVQGGNTQNFNSGFFNGSPNQANGGFNPAELLRNGGRLPSAQQLQRMLLPESSNQNSLPNGQSLNQQNFAPQNNGSSNRANSGQFPTTRSSGIAPPPRASSSQQPANQPLTNNGNQLTLPGRARGN